MDIRLDNLNKTVLIIGHSFSTSNSAYNNLYKKFSKYFFNC